MRASEALLKNFYRTVAVRIFLTLCFPASEVLSSSYASMYAIATPSSGATMRAILPP